jgi:hypothetical protein
MLRVPRWAQPGAGRMPAVPDAPRPFAEEEPFSDAPSYAELGLHSPSEMGLRSSRKTPMTA